MRDSTSRPALSSVQPKTTSGVQQQFGRGFQCYFGLRDHHFGIGRDPAYVGGTQIYFWFADVLGEGSVHAREVAFCQRVGIKQAEVTNP